MAAPHGTEADKTAFTAEPLQALPEDGYVFKTSWPLRTPDIDEEFRLRLDGVAGYIQEAGSEHLVDAGASDSHPFWIVQRTIIDTIVPIEWPQDITLRRWCSAISTRWCTMRVRLDGSKGGRIETEGFWIHMNKDAAAPARIAEEFFGRLATTTTEHRLRWRPSLTRQLGDSELTPFPLRRTDVDHFKHVNNAIYWHGVHEVLMARAPELAASPYRAVLEYRKPITFGESVTIHSDLSENGLYLWFVVDGEVRASANLHPLQPS